MIVNGKTLSLDQISGKTLRDLIEHFNLDPQTVAVERNGEIPGRSEWPVIQLENTDRIELIRFVGGG